jgi:hypothetical protein
VELRPATGEVEFPPFEAGSHINLHLPNGLSRSYSLCNSDAERGRYVVGVARDRASRGGSLYVHQQLARGQHGADRSAAQQLQAGRRGPAQHPGGRRHRRHAHVRACCSTWWRRAGRWSSSTARAQGRGLRRRHRGAGARTPCR